MRSRFSTIEKVVIGGCAVSLLIGVAVWQVRAHRSPATGVSIQKAGAPSAPAEELTAETVPGGETGAGAAVPVQTPEIFVKVSKSLLWHQNSYQEGWAGEVETALQRALLRPVPGSTVKPIVLLAEKQGAAILEVDALISFDGGGKAEARLTAELQRSGQLLAALEGQAVTTAPTDVKGSLAQAAFLRKIVEGAAENLSLQTQRTLMDAPPSAEKAEEEKPAEVAAGQVPQPAKGGFPWGWVVAGLTVLVVGLGRWAWRKGYRVQPPPNQQGGGP